LASSVTDRLPALASGQATGLNARDMEVLRLLARGARNREIAEQLFITPKTVEYHLSNLFAKLDVSNRTEAVRAAFERALITPGTLPPK
jgi:DNA-binding CsgD family transcriptional regulator